MIVMPIAHDQIDNVARVTRIGIARTISRRQFNSTRLAVELRRLLGNSSYFQKALNLGGLMQSEDGLGNAYDAIEKQL